MSFYDSETYTSDNQNSRSESSRSSRESPVQNVNLDNEISTTTSLPSNLFWRSRSQPPFGENSNHVNTPCGPNFLNTESNQQVSVINHAYPGRTLGSSHQTVGAGLSGSTRSVGLGSTNRTSVVGTPRSTHQRRLLRMARLTQNRDSIPGLLSSSSSNSSLLGRYRTISGVNSRPQSIDPSVCESHLSRLLRFSSLRFDDSVSDEAETSVKRQESPLGDCSNDEFAELPVRLGPTHYNFLPANRSSEQIPLSHSLPSSNSPSQEPPQEQPPLNPGNTHTNNLSPIPNSVIPTNSDCDNDNQDGNCSASATSTDLTSIWIPSTPKQCVVKFPKRGDLDHRRGVTGASSVCRSSLTV
ncbi:unnamed protein product [Schistosoma margrebowiei]|uniref:Uncharacterized protein n=1 Tax=Schistosoma margrebowiei TaxID=48269 RepID=A0A183M861_9TREM|nr:unnamed protein product [Schistosoma margrebowiei]